MKFLKAILFLILFASQVLAVNMDELASKRAANGFKQQIEGYYEDGDAGAPWTMIYNQTGRPGSEDGGFTVFGPGSDDYWSAADQTVAYVDRFGAKAGDAAFDNRAIIQAACDSSAMTIKLGKNKTYWLTTAVASPSTGYHVGILMSHQHSGKTFDGNDSWLKLQDNGATGAGPSAVYLVSTTVASNDVENITTKNLKIDGNHANQEHSITGYGEHEYIADGTYTRKLVVENIEVTETNGTGVSLRANESRAKNLYIHDTDQHGLATSQIRHRSEPYQFDIEGVRIIDTTGGSTDFTSPAGAAVGETNYTVRLRNYYSRNTGQFKTQENVKLFMSDVHMETLPLIKFGDADYVHLDNFRLLHVNDVDSGQSHCVTMPGSREVHLSNGVIESSNTYGQNYIVKTEASEKFTITNVRIDCDNNGSYGLSVQSATEDVLVRDVTIDNASTFYPFRIYGPGKVERLAVINNAYAFDFISYASADGLVYDSCTFEKGGYVAGHGVTFQNMDLTAWSGEIEATGGDFLVDVKNCKIKPDHGSYDQDNVGLIVDGVGPWCGKLADLTGLEDEKIVAIDRYYLGDYTSRMQPWQMQYHSSGRPASEDGGFVIFAAGADDYWSAADQSVAVPERFGVVPDSVNTTTDNRVAFQACIDAAAATDGCDYVKCNPGQRYRFASMPLVNGQYASINFDQDHNGLTFDGNGSTLYLADSSTTGDASRFFYIRPDAAKSGNLDKLTIKNLNLESNGGNQDHTLTCFAAMREDNTHMITNLRVSDCRFDYGDIDDTEEGSAALVQCHSATLHNIWAGNASQHGFAFQVGLNDNSDEGYLQATNLIAENTANMSFDWSSTGATADDGYGIAHMTNLKSINGQGNKTQGPWKLKINGFHIQDSTGGDAAGLKLADYRSVHITGLTMKDGGDTRDGGVDTQWAQMAISCNGGSAAETVVIDGFSIDGYGGAAAGDWVVNDTSSFPNKFVLKNGFIQCNATRAMSNVDVCENMIIDASAATDNQSINCPRDSVYRNVKLQNSTFGRGWYLNAKNVTLDNVQSDMFIFVSESDCQINNTDFSYCTGGAAVQATTKYAIRVNNCKNVESGGQDSDVCMIIDGVAEAFNQLVACPMADGEEVIVDRYSRTYDALEPWTMIYRASGRPASEDGGFTSYGSLAGADDYWEAKDQSVAHVDRFGAKAGDAAFDNRSPVQAAVDSSADRIEFGENKTYHFLSHDTIRLPCLINFDHNHIGKRVHGNGSTIYVADGVIDTSVWLVKVHSYDGNGDAGDVRFYDLTIDGNEANNGGGAASAFSQVTQVGGDYIYDVEYHGCTAVNHSGTGFVNIANGAVVTNCKASNCVTGISFSKAMAAYSPDAEMVCQGSNLLVEDCSGVGFNWSGSQNDEPQQGIATGNFSNLTSINCTQNKTQGPWALKINGFTVDGESLAGAMGMKVSGVRQCDITNSYFKDCPRTAIDEEVPGIESLDGALTGAAVTSVVINGSIDANAPDSGTLRVYKDTEDYVDIAYSSWTGSTFTITSTDFSSDNASDGNTVVVMPTDHVLNLINCRIDNCGGDAGSLAALNLTQLATEHIENVRMFNLTGKALYQGGDGGTAKNIYVESSISSTMPVSINNGVRVDGLDIHGTAFSYDLNLPATGKGKPAIIKNAKFRKRLNILGHGIRFEKCDFSLVTGGAAINSTNHVVFADDCEGLDFDSDSTRVIDKVLHGTAANLGDSTWAGNTESSVKKLGRQAFITGGDGRILWASGTGATDSWDDTEGVADITPTP